MSSVATIYQAALRAPTPRTRETAAPEDELAWQVRWFSGACGREFTTADGRRVVVTDFGEWNREAGPDFARATVVVDDQTHHGAIEVDLDAAGWEQHRHAVNPAYENVVLHVVVRRPARRHFTRTASHRDVPQVCLADHPGAKEEWTGLAAARPGRCAAPLRALAPAKIEELLAVAARRRLETKGAVLETMIRARGAAEALYEALAITLGYKNNKLPFQILAQRVPRNAAATARGDALLFGLAGFLEKPVPPPGAAHAEVAKLWTTWWKLRAAHAHAILPRGSWKLSGLRPANHPLRRLAALGAIARDWKAVRAALESADPQRLQDVLGRLDHPFWSHHTTWQSPRRTKPLALLGPDRIRAIYANVALPLALARSGEPAWLDLPSGEPNATLRIVSARLFGGPLPRRLPRRLFVEQGLLQIYADFCLRDHDECARCRFPGLVQTLTA